MAAAGSEQSKITSIKLTIRQEGQANPETPLKEQVFDAPLISVGRAASSSIVLEAPQIAPEQWLIINDNGAPVLVNRAEGTIWQEEVLPLAAQRPLADGDLVRTGEFVITISLLGRAIDADAPAPTEAAAEVALIPLVADAPDAPPEEALATRPANRFAAILDSLRTDEDRYYFLLESGGQAGSRLLVEDQELVVGWDQTGGNITADPWAVALPRVRVTKNWSGVFAAAPHPEEVEVNGEPLREPRRLRHGDHLVIAPPLAPDEDGVVLIFHEPTSLVVLDNLLPESLPLPVGQGAETADAQPATATSGEPLVVAPEASKTKPRTRLA